MTATDPAALLTAIDEALAIWSGHWSTELQGLPYGHEYALQCGACQQGWPCSAERYRALLKQARAELVRHTGIVVTYPAPVGWPPLSRDCEDDVRPETPVPD